MTASIVITLLIIPLLSFLAYHFVVLPAKKLRDTLDDLRTCLFNNCNRMFAHNDKTDEMRESLRDFAARLPSLAGNIHFYWVAKLLFKLPPKNIVESNAVGLITGLSNTVGNGDTNGEINKCLADITSELNLPPIIK